MTNRKRVLLIAVLALACAGCAAAVANPTSGDPTERGLSYVAGAIVIHAIIQAVCNK